LRRGQGRWRRAAPVQLVYAEPDESPLLADAKALPFSVKASPRAEPPEFGWWAKRRRFSSRFAESG
jgi:hypothetical protein